MLLPIVPTGAFAFSSTPTFVPPCPPLHHRLHRRRPLQTTSPLLMSANDYGLTDDGDFAILGVNVEEKAEGDDSDGNGPSSTSISGSSNSGTEIGWQGVGNMLFNEELLKSGRVDMGVGSMNKYKDFRGNEIVPKVDPIVKEWLLEILPSLKDSDIIEAYAEGLSTIGFHPQCASMCELKYEDLDFMKALHQRYLFKEITGEEHPFEP